jgi:cysteine synthase A
MSRERFQLMKLLGARVELVPSRSGIPGMFEKDDIVNTLKRAEELCGEIPGSVLLNQFDNQCNPDAHESTTAAEIIGQAGERLAAFVAACGTGGTFSGVARVLKEEYPTVKRVVVEPENSAVISGGEPGLHKLQGIGEGFVPNVMDVGLADEVAKVSDEEALSMARRLASEEGILSGISGGANVCAAIRAAEGLPEGAIVATLIPDTALRYLSTDLCE